MLERPPFRLFKRKLKSGKIVYYARFLRPDGSYSAGRSTGEATKRKAEIAAWTHFQTGNITFKENVTLKEFTKGFFDWNGEWALSKRSAGRRLSEKQCRCNNSFVRLHINRLIGNKYFTEIDTASVRLLRNTLYREGYAGSTINKVLDALRAILEQAEEMHLLRGMPRIERAGLNQKEKGILSNEEVKMLFNLTWDDARAYTANLIAASTGFRLSEIQGLKLRNVQEGYLEITGAWIERKYREGTKNGQKSRRVPIPPSVQETVNNLIEKNPYGTDQELFLFYTYNSPNRPIQDRQIVKGFHKALTDIGIPEKERKNRNITFHSHRHFFNSLLIESRIPLQKIQQLTGHLSASMTERYYHLGGMEDVAAIQRNMFELVKAG